METNFFVGQEVVAIKDHSQGNFKKGDEFLIQDIKNGCCKLLIDVGIRTGKDFINCRCCGDRKPNDNYYCSQCFSPIKKLSELTYDEVRSWFKKDVEASV
jgi:hypothetical protein